MSSKLFLSPRVSRKVQIMGSPLAGGGRSRTKRLDEVDLISGGGGGGNGPGSPGSDGSGDFAGGVVGGGGGGPEVGFAVMAVSKLGRIGSPMTQRVSG